MSYLFVHLNERSNRVRLAQDEGGAGFLQMLGRAATFALLSIGGVSISGYNGVAATVPAREELSAGSKASGATLATNGVAATLIAEVSPMF